MNSLSTSEDDMVYFTDDDNIYNAPNAKANADRVGASRGRHGITSYCLFRK